MCVLGPLRDQNRVGSDPRELKLHMVVNQHVGAENQTDVLHG